MNSCGSPCRISKHLTAYNKLKSTIILSLQVGKIWHGERLSDFLEDICIGMEVNPSFWSPRTAPWKHKISLSLWNVIQKFSCSTFYWWLHQEENIFLLLYVNIADVNYLSSFCCILRDSVCFLSDYLHVQHLFLYETICMVITNRTVIFQV